MERIIGLIPALLILLAISTPAGADPDFKWEFNFDGGDGRTDIGHLTLTDTDGNLIAGGVSTPSGEQANSIVLKLDRISGDPIWSTHYSSGGENEIVINGLLWDGYGDLLVGEYIQACVG